MAVRLLYFAWVRERIGVADEEVPLEGPLPLAALVERLRARTPGHAHALGEPARLRAAINQEFADWNAEVHPGDEVALFPPVTGG